ncbi:MAG: DNA adenine methylase [Gemmatimonadetes bacterium]|nr:DNA adenine methylase [Gemmatimonadota bacterium]
MVKSPLRYPGGKSRAVSQIIHLLPQGLETLASPFVGGASIELAAASRGIRVYCYDAFAPLVDFWQAVLKDASHLALMAAEYHPLKRTEFYALQKRYSDIEGQFERAAAFYALNRASYSGTTLSGGMSPGHPRFTPSALSKLRSFSIDGFSVELADFQESIPAHADDFLYLDPPYANGESLYGERGDLHADFDHAALAHLLRGRDGWVLSYNDCEKVRDLYEGYTFVTPEWAYGIANKADSNEAIILSNDYVRVL